MACPTNTEQVNAMIERYLPILSWIKSYNKHWLKNDLVAGMTLGVMLVPQGMAYAMIVGLPPIHGLYAALVPQLVYALTGTSRQLAVGPVAMDSLLVATGVGALGLIGPQDHIAAVLLLTLMVGLLQLLLGFFKMGFFANFLSRPVIAGFSTAAAILIGLGQLHHILGIDGVSSAKIHEQLAHLAANLGRVHPLTLGIGALALGLMYLLGKWTKRLPVHLIAVFLGILAVTFFGLEDLGVKIVGEVPQGLPGFSPPPLSWDRMGQLLPIAITVALFGFMESVSIAKALEEKNMEDFLDPDQELRALGLSNLLGSLFLSFSVSGSFSRTAVNASAGARTGMSLVFSALLIGAVLLFFTPLFHNLPTLVLGAIILLAVSGLVDFGYPKKLWAFGKGEFALWAATFLLTLFIGLIEGILLGVLLSLALLVSRTSKPHMPVLGRIRGTNYFKNVDRFLEDVELQPDKHILRFDSQLYFGNRDYFKRRLQEQLRQKGPQLRYVILNAEPISYMDSSAVAMLEQLILELRERDIQFMIAAAVGPTRDILKSSGIVALLGEENFFVQTIDAVEYADKHQERSSIQRKVSSQTKTKS